MILNRTPSFPGVCNINHLYASGTERWAVESKLSTIYSLLLDPDEEDRDEATVAYDAGEYDERLPQPCPGCGQIFKGTTEKGRKSFLATHIRLHNLQGEILQIIQFFSLKIFLIVYNLTIFNNIFIARRGLLCTSEEIKAASNDICIQALDEILAMEGDGATLSRVKAIALLLKDHNSANEIYDLIVGEVAGLIDQRKPIFLSQERHETVGLLHGLINDYEFRRKCLTIINQLTAGLEGASQFLASFFMRVKDRCQLFRLSKMRERLSPPSMAQPDDRIEVVLYVSGWVLWRTKRECWKNIKTVKNTAIFRCIKDSFSEGGANAEKITELKVRKWLDKKNRGKEVNGVKINGLTIPSLEAYQFFSRLDAHIQGFESRDGLKASLTQDALMSKVYDDLTLLDSWGRLVGGMEEGLQQYFLEFVINLYRKLLGNAVAKRIVRGIFKRKTIATRTNLKRNPTSKTSTSSKAPARRPAKK